MQPYAQTQAAIDILAEAEEQARPVDRVMAYYFRNNRYIGSKDKKAISEQVYNTLRVQGMIDWALQQVDLMPNPRLRVAAQMVLAGEDVEATFNGERFAPRALSGKELAVLEIAEKTDHAPTYAKLNYPAWAGELVLKAFDEKLHQAMEALNQQAPTDIRLNTLKDDKAGIAMQLADEGLQGDVTPLSTQGIRLKNPGNLFGMQAFKEGLFEVQDAGSQIIAALCLAQPGMKITDYCAGAGGKTLALAACMGNKGVLTAGDIIEPKIGELKKRLRRAGVDNVQTQVWPIETKNTWLKRRKKTQDVLLLDVPCSGSGVWRRNPDAKWILNPERLAELCEIQQSILQQASGLVRVGGRLVYATCSVFMEENEAQIEAFLSQNKGFKIVPVADVWAEAEKAGTVHGKCPTKEPMLRLAPHTTNTDGFFLTVLERTADDDSN